MSDLMPKLCFPKNSIDIIQPVDVGEYKGILTFYKDMFENKRNILTGVWTRLLWFRSTVH